MFNYDRLCRSGPASRDKLASLAAPLRGTWYHMLGEMGFAHLKPLRGISSLRSLVAFGDNYRLLIPFAIPASGGNRYFNYKINF